MAIATMTHLALRKDKPVAQGGGQGAGLEGVAESVPSGEQVVTSAIDQMVAYVPSEVIGIYVAGVGIIGPASPRAKWGLLGLALLLIPLFIWLSSRIARQKDPEASQANAKLFWVGAFAVVAFLAWAASLPDSPFALCNDNATRIGSFAAVVLAALVPKLAAAVGIAQT